MEYLGDKLSVAQSQVSGWVGNVRRSLQGALNFVSSRVEQGGGGAEENGGFKRAASLRGLASRGRESFRRFSLRSQQRLSLHRRTTSPTTPTHAEQVKQCVSGQEEARDTDNLVQETDSQYGTWETGLRTEDSLTPATPSSDGNLTPSPRKPTPPHTPVQVQSTDTPDGSALSPQTQAESLPFLETSAPLLDSSVLRSRAQLSKKNRRAPPSRAARHSAALSLVPEGSGGDAEEWRYRDSTEEKANSSKQEEDSDSEEKTRGGDSRTPTSSSASQSQRVALFPGMDPSALKAQLKKRSDTDNQTDGAAPSSQPTQSPKSTFLPRAARVLPPAGGKENGEESSPQWLKELKSKKRLSQYDNDS